MEDMVPFENLISHLIRSEEKQSNIDSVLDMMKQEDPNSLVQKLVNFLSSSSHDIDTRDTCAELLRKFLTDIDNCGIWYNLSMSTQSSTKFILLNSLKLEESTPIIEKLCEMVSKLAIQILPQNDWPELFHFFEHCLTSTSNSYSNMSAFLIISQLAKTSFVFSTAIGKTFVPHTKMFRSLFHKSLNDNLHLQVRIAALIAVTNFILCLDTSWYQDLLPAMIWTLTEALENGEKVAANSVLSNFCLLAYNEPRLFRRHLVVVVNGILDIAEHERADEQTIANAVNFLITLVERRKEAPAGMMKQLPLFTTRCFAVVLKSLLHIEDEPIWHTTTSKAAHQYVEETSNYGAAMIYVSRLSIALGGHTIAPVAKEQLYDYLAAPHHDWEERHAALIALAQIAQACSQENFKYLEQLVNMIPNYLQHPHPRVRWAAINAIGELLTVFSQDLLQQYHNQVLPAIGAAIVDFQSPRVQARATHVLQKFGKLGNLIPYLDQMLSELLALLQNDNQMVQDAALIALGTLAGLAKEHFKNNYDSIMPQLKTILINANHKSNLQLCSKAMECISDIGMVVGKEKFRDDANQVVEVLKALQGSQLNLMGDYSVTTSSLTVWYRICKCMEQDFLPYMNIAMPLLIQCAQLLSNVTFDESEDDLVIHGYDTDDISIIKPGDREIYIEGSVFYMKESACKTLGVLADMLKEEFHPWILEVASVLVPLLEFNIKETIQITAASAMPHLLYSAKLAVEKGVFQGGNKSYFEQLSGDIIQALLEASRYYAKLGAIMLDELNKCLQICGPILGGGQVRDIVDVIKDVITNSSSRKQKLRERTKREDFDAEETESMRKEIEIEDRVFSKVSDIVCTLNAAFLPLLDELSSYLMPSWDKDSTAKERENSIHIFNDLVEHCSEPALKYYAVYLPLLLDASNDENPYVRGAALYGLGLCAGYGGFVFRPFVENALSRITFVMTHLHALEPVNVHAYERAVCAFGKICQFHRESINSGQILSAWLNCLPVKHNLDEAMLVHDQLCSMVERSDGELLSPNYQHLPKIISVFAEVLCARNDLATEQTADRMIHLLRNFQHTLPQAPLALVWSLLLPHQEMELESIL